MTKFGIGCSEYFHVGIYVYVCGCDALFLIFLSFPMFFFKRGALGTHAYEYIGILYVCSRANACALHVCAFSWAREMGWPSQPPPIPRCRAGLFPRGRAARRREKILPADREVSE